MDILSHSLSGLAVGTVLATFADKPGSKLMIMTIATLGGALPDLDAISMWSGFDESLGSWFQLEHSGRFIYASKFWYSHHAFLHSLLAPLVWLGLFISILLIGKSISRKSPLPLLVAFQSKRLILFAFFGGYWIHLLEDLPTPSASWGGVNLFWPAPQYFGGWGKIWWWNNYDIFIIILSVIVLNLFLAALNKYRRFAIRKMSLLVFCIGFGLAFWQVNSRDFDFGYQGTCPDYQAYEKESKRIQKEILGDKIFNLMERFDHSLNLYF